MTQPVTRPLHFQTYQLVVEPLAPIHVGSGQAIEPLEYVLKVQGDAGFLIAFDLPGVLSDLAPAQREEFNRVVGRNDLVLIRRWLQEHADGARRQRFVVQVQAGAYAEIAQNLDNPDRLGEIHLFAREPGVGRPYLPGSSIKGSIRTAIVDGLAHDPAAPRERLRQAAGDGRGASFEAAVLGNQTDRGGPDLYRDPLRQLAISDITLPGDACYIDRVKLVRRSKARPRDPRWGDADPSGIVMYREMTWSALDGEGLKSAGEARLYPGLGDPRLMGSDRSGRANCVTRSLDIASVCRWCNAFYRPRLEKELNDFVMDAEVSGVLRRHADSVGPEQCLVRLGRHSHFECVTIGDFHRPPQRGFGQTRSYAAGALPLGWAKLTFTRLS